MTWKKNILYVMPGALDMCDIELSKLNWENVMFWKGKKNNINKYKGRMDFLFIFDDLFISHFPLGNWGGDWEFPILGPPPTTTMPSITYVWYVSRAHTGNDNAIPKVLYTVHTIG